MGGVAKGLLRTPGATLDTKTQDEIVARFDKFLADSQAAYGGNPLFLKMAISGQQASFLSGGRIYIPVAQNNNGFGSTVTLEYSGRDVGPTRLRKVRHAWMPLSQRSKNSSSVLMDRISLSTACSSL